MDTKTIERPALLSNSPADNQPAEPKPLRRRSKRLAPMTVDTVGEPAHLAGIASLLLHHHRKQLAQQLSPEVHDHA